MANIGIATKIEKHNKRHRIENEFYKHIVHVHLSAPESSACHIHMWYLVCGMDLQFKGD